MGSGFGDHRSRFRVRRVAWTGPRDPLGGCECGRRDVEGGPEAVEGGHLVVRQGFLGGASGSALAWPTDSLVGGHVFRYVEAGAVGVVARVDPEQPMAPPVVCSGCPCEDDTNTAAIHLELWIYCV